MIRKLTPLFKQVWQELAQPSIANLLTFCRLVLTPFMVHAILQTRWMLALAFLLLAGITDFLDGYLARRLGEQTLLGSFLDPLADKVFLVSSFIALTLVPVPALHIPWWFAAFAALREILMIVGALTVAHHGKAYNVKPTIFGKLTTLFQIIFIVWLCVCYLVQWKPQITYSAVLIMLVIFSIFSLLHYGKIAIQLVREDR